MRTMTVLFLSTVVMLSACAPTQEDPLPRRELLIYCGTTMIRPIQEIAHIIEEKHDCRVKILRGGSGDLLRAIKINAVGDLFLPGAESYMATCVELGLAKEPVCVGYNQAALLVQKGNPKGIPASLHVLTNRKYRTALADHQTGSIGREAHRILMDAGIWEATMTAGPVITTDSKGITAAISRGDVDVGINWRATAAWPEARVRIDALPIDENLTPRRALMLGVLTCSSSPQLANMFKDYVASPAGRDIFARHGFWE